MPRIFISHSSQDASAALAIATGLEREGFAATDLFLDIHPESGIPPGRTWEAEIYEQIAEADAVLFLGSKAATTSKWCFVELSFARALGRLIIPLKVDEGEPHELLSDTQWLDYPGGGDRSLNRIVDVLFAAGLDPRQSFPWDGSRPPYPGLAAFSEEEAAVFYGREEQIRLLVDQFDPRNRRARGDCVAVIGPSGSGKSSLVHAGLLPRLRQGPSDWLIPKPMRPSEGRSPLVALSQRLAALDGQTHFRDIADRLGHAPADIAEISHDILEGKRDAERLLVVVDQAEELVTATEDSAANEFLSVLQEASRPRSPLGVILTIRSEFLTALLQESLAVSTALTAEILVAPLHRDSLRAVIEGPARRARLAFEAGLVDRMIADTRGGDALPLLAFALRELYERARRNRTSAIRLADYEAIGAAGIGGVVGALIQRADAALARTSDPSSAVQTLLALANVEADDEPTRRRVSIESFDGSNRQVVSEFVDERLLRSEAGSDGKAVVEVSHEALLRQWPPLKQAIADSRAELRARTEAERAARDWEAANRESSYCLTGARLAAASEAIRATGHPLSEQLEAFLKASEHHDRGTRELKARQVAERVRYTYEADPEKAALAALAAFEEYVPLPEVAVALNAALDANRTRALLLGHSAPILSVEWSADGTRVVTASEDGTAAIWDADRGARVEQIAPELGQISHASFHPSGAQIVTAHLDGTARLWSIGGGESKVVARHDERVRTARFSVDGQHILTASEDHTAGLWDTSGSCRVKLQGHESLVLAAAFSPLGDKAVTASADFTVRIWDLESGRQLQRLEGHRDWVRSPSFSPDASFVVAASEDATSLVWNAHTGEIVERVDGHSSRVRGAAFAPDGGAVATASGDKTARRWSFPGIREQARFTGHRERLRDLAISGDGARLATASEDCTARIWLFDETPNGKILLHRDCRMRALGVAEDRGLLYAGGDDGSVIQLSLANGEVVAEGRHEDRVSALAELPAGGGLLTTSYDHTLRAWSSDGGFREVARFDSRPRSLAVSSRGVIAVGLVDGQVLLARNGGDFELLHRHDADVIALEFAPTGDLLASASADQSARIVEIADVNAQETLQLHGDWVRGCSFSEDGSRLVTAGEDAVIVIWNVSTRQPECVVRGHTDWVRSATFSPDGTRVVSASGDGTARIWTIGGAELHVLAGHGDLVESARFLQDGCTILTASHDGTIRRWKSVPPEQLGTVARQALRRSLTPEEREELGLPSPSPETRVDPAE